MYAKLLKHKSFRLFCGGTALSRLAANILQFALAIYVLDMTRSAFIYSTVLSVIILPRIILSPIAEYLANRKNSLNILKYGILMSFILMGCFFIIHSRLMMLNICMIYILVSCQELCEVFIKHSEEKVLMCTMPENQINAASEMSALFNGIVEIMSPVIGCFFYNVMGLTSILLAVTIFEGVALVSVFSIQAKPDYVLCHEEIKVEYVFSFHRIHERYKEIITFLRENPTIVYVLLFAPILNFFINPLFSVTTAYYFRVTMDANTEMYAMFNSFLGIATLLAPFIAITLIQNVDEKKINMTVSNFCAVTLLTLSGYLLLLGARVSQNGLLRSVTLTMMILVVGVSIMSMATSITLKKRIPKVMMNRILPIVQLCASISIPIGHLFYGICADHFSITFSLLISVCGLLLAYSIMLKAYEKGGDE